jgi:hypothetical protein
VTSSLAFYLRNLSAADDRPEFSLADMDVRCSFSDLAAPSCWHCRSDVQARLADDPVFAAWVDSADAREV